MSVGTRCKLNTRRISSHTIALDSAILAMQMCWQNLQDPQSVKVSKWSRVQYDTNSLTCSNVDRILCVVAILKELKSA